MMRISCLAFVTGLFVCGAVWANIAPGPVPAGYGAADESLQRLWWVPIFLDEEHGDDQSNVAPIFTGPNSGADTGQKTMLAHAILVKSMPEKEQTIDVAPPRIELWFNEGVGSKFTSLAVVDSGGKRVDKKDAALDFSDRSHLTATLESLPPGRYGVRYRVQSADGHIVTGKYFFTVDER